MDDDRRVQEFSSIYKHNLWSGRESRSGTGSDMVETKNIRRELPGVLKRLGIKSLLDIPCGDLNWMRHIDMEGIEYTGADIVPDIIEDNRARFPDRRFVVLDLVKDKLPEVDMVFCRDIIGHMSQANAELAIRNILDSGAKYLMATDWPKADNRTDIEDAKWRPINMTLLLEHTGAQLIEEVSEDIPDKMMSVWQLKETP